MRQNLNTVSENNTTQAPPYGSTAEGLLYEIMMDLGGPGLGGQLPFRAENPTGAPPYKSTAEGLLYEILGAIKNGGGGSTGPTGTTATIKYGWVPEGEAVNIAALSSLSVLQGVQQYSVLPPAYSGAAASPTANFCFVIAEPLTEPAKTAALWLRNAGTVFVHQPIAAGNIFSADASGGYRIYRSSSILGMYTDGSYAGPVYLSTVQTTGSAGGGTGGGGGSTTVYSYMVRIGLSPCGSDPVTVFSLADTFETGMQLYRNPGMTIPADSGFVAPYANDGANPGTVIIEGEIFNVTDGLVGSTTNNIC